MSEWLAAFEADVVAGMAVTKGTKATKAHSANPIVPTVPSVTRPRTAGGGLSESHEDRGGASLPPEWRHALTRLGARPRPESIPAERWTQALADASYLIRDWGGALFRCGWTLPDLLSAHREAPLAGFAAMGLCLLIQGRKIGPIDAERIAVRQPGGAVLHFRRPCLLVAETVMLWDLP